MNIFGYEIKLTVTKKKKLNVKKIIKAARKHLGYHEGKIEKIKALRKVSYCLFPEEALHENIISLIYAKEFVEKYWMED